MGLTAKETADLLRLHEEFEEANALLAWLEDAAVRNDYAPQIYVKTKLSDRNIRVSWELVTKLQRERVEAALEAVRLAGGEVT